MADTKRTFHQREFKATTPKGKRLVALASIHSFDGQAPYLSITADLWGARKSEPEECGQLPELIRENISDLSDSLPFHSAAWPGVPMHYVENSLHWYDQYHRGGVGIGAVLPIEALKALRNSAVLTLPGDKYVEELVKLPREEVRTYLEGRRPKLREYFRSDMINLFGLTPADLAVLDEAAEHKE